MKRLICVILMLSLCACSGKKQVIPIVSGMDFTAVIHYYNEIYECAVEVDKGCCAVMRVTSPEDLAGLKFICKGDTLTAEFMGLSYTPDTESMPSGAVAKTVYGILFDCYTNKPAASDDGGNYSISGKVDKHNYTLSLSPSGLPLSVQIPDKSYTVDFKNVTLK